jgi:hypothetical protein
MASTASTASTNPLAGAVACILHCEPLPQRLPNVQRLERLLQAAGASVSVIGGAEPTAANLDELRAQIDLEPASLGEGPLADFFRPAIGSLHMRQISNAIKHLAALRAIAAADRPGWHLVLEDDALSNDDTSMPQLARSLADLSAQHPDADMLFLGLPSRVIPASATAAPVFEPLESVFRCLPCCDSYALTASAARRLVAAWLPLRFATHIHLSWCMQSLGLRAHLVAPNIFADGSKVGVYLSAIDVNNRLVWNPQYCRAEQLVTGGVAPPTTQTGGSQAVGTKTGGTPGVAQTGGPQANGAVEHVGWTANEKAELDDLEGGMRFKEHPDAAHLFAVRAKAEGRLADAHRLFKHAMDLYDRESSLMGPKCQFLRDYMSLYREAPAVYTPACVMGGATPV